MVTTDKEFCSWCTRDAACAGVTTEQAYLAQTHTETRSFSRFCGHHRDTQRRVRVSGIDHGTLIDGHSPRNKPAGQEMHFPWVRRVQWSCSVESSLPCPENEGLLLAPNNVARRTFVVGRVSTLECVCLWPVHTRTHTHTHTASAHTCTHIHTRTHARARMNECVRCVKLRTHESTVDTHRTFFQCVEWQNAPRLHMVGERCKPVWQTCVCWRPGCTDDALCRRL